MQMKSYATGLISRLSSRFLTQEGSAPEPSQERVRETGELANFLVESICAETLTVEDLEISMLIDIEAAVARLKHRALVRLAGRT